MTTFSLQPKTAAPDRCLKILSLLQDLRALASRAFGIDVKTHSDRSIQQFLQLDEATRQQVERMLQDYLNIFHMSVIEGAALSAKELQVRCVRSALFKYGLFVKCDLEDYVQDEDIIEMYDSTNTQIYRNLEFLRFCSYDFLRVMTTSWFVLWDRSDKVIQDLQGFLMEAFRTGQPVRVVYPEHMMREREAEQRSFLTRFTWAIPVFHSDAAPPSAFISLASAREIALETSNTVEFLRR